MTLIVQPAVYLSSSVYVPPFPLNHARIGYKTILPDSTITATSEAAGFPASALSNPLTYDQFRPDSLPVTVLVDRGQAVDVDYIGIGAHDMADHASVVTIEYSTDNATWTTLASFSPGDNTPIMLIFDTVTARYFRFTIEAASQFFIGACYIGQALVMQRAIYGGHAPINLSRVTEYETTRSELGQWLGRSVIRKGVATDFSWSHLTAAWYRENFDPFVKAARSTPFFIAWNPKKFQSEVGFCMTTGDIRPSNMGVRDYLQVSMSVQGISDD